MYHVYIFNTVPRNPQVSHNQLAKMRIDEIFGLAPKVSFLVFNEAPDILPSNLLCISLYKYYTWYVCIYMQDPPGRVLVRAVHGPGQNLAGRVGSGPPTRPRPDA